MGLFDVSRNPYDEEEDEEALALLQLGDPLAEDEVMQLEDPLAEEPSSGMEIGDLEMLAQDEKGPSMDIGDLEVLSESEGGPTMEIGEMYEPGVEIGDLTMLAEQPPAVPPPKETSTYADDVIGPSGVAFNVPDNRQDMPAQQKRVRELWEAQQMEEPDTSRAEREWRAMNQRPTQDDFRRAWIIRLFDKEASAQMTEMLQGQLKHYDAGLAQARALDQKEAERTRRVDPGMAELLVLAGMSPESAARARAGDPSTQLARSLGALGVRLRGQDQSLLETNVKATAGVQGQQSKQNWQGQQNELQRQNNLDVAAAQKKGAGGGGLRGLPREEVIPHVIAQSSGKTVDEIRAVLAGQEVPGVSPALASRIRSSGVTYSAMSGEKFDQLTKLVESQIGAEERKPGVTAAQKRADPAQRGKLATKFLASGRKIDAALKGWKQLSPLQKDLLVKIGPNPKPAAVQQFLQSGGDQGSAAAVWRLVNEAIHEISGANVTDVESPRLQRGFGVVLSGDGSMFAAPDALDGWLKELQTGWNQDYAVWSREYPGLLDGIATGGGDAGL